MIPSIMCYVPPTVEPLGPTTTSFQTRIHDPQISNQIDAPELIGLSMKIQMTLARLS